MPPKALSRVHAHEPRSCTRLSGEARDRLCGEVGRVPRFPSTQHPHPLITTCTNMVADPVPPAASRKIEPARHDALLLRRRRDAAVHEGPVGRPDERQALLGLYRHVLVEELRACGRHVSDASWTCEWTCRAGGHHCVPPSSLTSFRYVMNTRCRDAPVHSRRCEETPLTGRRHGETRRRDAPGSIRPFLSVW